MGKSERWREWESGRECVRVERSLTVMRERASRSTSTEKLAALLAPRTLQHKKKRNYMNKKNNNNNNQWAILSTAFSTSPPFLFLFSSQLKLLFMQSKFWSHKSEWVGEGEAEGERRREILCLTIIAWISTITASIAHVNAVLIAHRRKVAELLTSFSGRPLPHIWLGTGNKAYK